MVDSTADRGGIARSPGMREVVSDLWVVETPLRFLGIEVGRRMTVVRLGSGSLWLHSPTPLTDALRASLDSLGEPRFVISASAIHGHLFMEQYRDAYPNVELFAAPGLDRRRKDLAFDAILGSVPDLRWSEDLDQAAFLGHLAPEIVFLHRASRTLIVGDLLMAFEVSPTMPLAARLVWRLEGVYGSPGTPRSFRLATRNRRAARRSVERILAWDFDRIVVGHGEVVETGGRAAFERAMGWLSARG
jgi:hypothetical protein